MKCVVATLLLWSAAVSQPWVPEATWECARDESSQQVAWLLSARMPEARLQAVPRVLQDLQLTLTTRWPGSRLIVIGSIVNGLTTAQSDVDCSLVLPHRADTSQTLIEHATEMLRNYPQLYTDFYPITWGLVPLVSFIHVPTQFKVDLSINNFNGIQISNLFNYLIHIDERNFNLIFIVKHWAKVHKFTSSHLLPNYGLILMVMFYLQQRNMMPSIASLQADAYPLFVDEWNNGFCEIEYKTQNDVPLNILLGGFFEFYVNFDYDKYVVCPYTGYPIEKHLFEDLNMLPNKLGLYVQNVKANVSKPLSLENAFVVQDVFIHNDNVAKNLDTSPNSTFAALFQYAAKKFRQNNHNFLDKIFNCTT